MCLRAIAMIIETNKGSAVGLISIPEDRARDIAAASADPASRWNPAWAESWWWLWLPILATIALIVTFRINEQFYRDWVKPEGYGVLELSQFLLAFGGFVIALRLMLRPYVKGWSLLFVACAAFAIVCFFIAGEEHSWGQHFFHWNTPDYWSQLNRQQETNLHNSFSALNHPPQVILEIGIVAGGILMPLWQRIMGPFQDPLLKLFAPPVALMPTALCAMLFKFAKTIGNDDAALDIVARPSEAMELFFYLFIFGYLVVFARRIAALEAQPDAKP